MTQNNSKIMFKLLNERIKFYAGISNEQNVFMQKFEVFEHPAIPKSFFIYLKYQLNNNGTFTDHEEIETFTDDKGWTCMVNQNNQLQLHSFLKNKKTCMLNTAAVTLK